jgi:hypothetical protein
MRDWLHAGTCNRLLKTGSLRSAGTDIQRHQCRGGTGISAMGPVDLSCLSGGADIVSTLRIDPTLYRATAVSDVNGPCWRCGNQGPIDLGAVEVQVPSTASALLAACQGSRILAPCMDIHHLDRGRQVQVKSANSDPHQLIFQSIC